MSYIDYLNKQIFALLMISLVLSTGPFVRQRLGTTDTLQWLTSSWLSIAAYSTIFVLFGSVAKYKNWV